MPELPDYLPRLAQMHKLRAFAAVARHGNVHRASEALHLSQPSVTRAVRQLEMSLGTLLFERTTKGMRLTAAGDCAYRRVERALEALRAAGSDILRRAVPGRHRVPPTERLSETVTEAMLTALVAVARSGSEKAAAAAVGVTQPALNRNLHLLEHLAGVPLFMRSGRGTQLTEPGELLLMHVKLALSEIRVADEELVSLRGELAGLLVVGALPLSSGHLVPLATERTLRNHPGLNIRIVDGTYETLGHGLRCADVNLIVGALRSDESEPYSIHEPLFDDTLSVVVRAQHPLLRQQNIGSLNRLREHEWVVPLAGTPSRVLFDGAFRAESVEPPNTQLEANSPSIVRTLLLSSDRLALVSHRQIQHELRQGILVILPVEVKFARRTIGIARLRNTEPSPGMLALLDALRAVSAE
ncbi:LysR family transcriptional regulator [Caballeronia sp. DA-9]|uniref:LysR family transcriptional regulator n=1 Tax=Caballeronia sp. DA-9 TaxID=3436237 RepID=UPI003F670D40